ncbi:signal peptidase I [Heyndrickxia sporothermodurans]
MKKKELYSWIKSIAIAVIIVFICRQFLFTPVVVHGESMLPTFQNNNRVVVSKISSIKRFDMVVFDAPDVEERKELDYIKRVIGLPGDQIEVKNDVLYVNGKAYKESYVKKEQGPKTEDFTLQELTGSKTVPNGFYFVMGDNRHGSDDSRSFGFIPEDSIIGKVVFRFYPFTKIGMPK